MLTVSWITYIYFKYNIAGGTMEFWVDILEQFRVELTSVLQPDRYFDKFRSEKIFDESDTQKISSETLHPTRVQKAGEFSLTLLVSCVCVCVCVCVCWKL